MYINILIEIIAKPLILSQHSEEVVHHAGEDDEHDDRADVDEHVHQRDELGAEDEVAAGQAEEGDDEPERGVHHLSAGHRQRAGGHGERAGGGEGDLVAGDYEGYVHWLSADDGSVIARGHVFDEPIRSQPIVVGNRVIVLGAFGEIAALRFAPNGDR